MHIEYLKYFYEVASVKSISKVANSSHISQPALSQQIQRLEDSLGFKLLERSNKGVELTDAGRIVEKYAKNLIRYYDNMVEDLVAINKKNCTIRIEACTTMATYALPCTIYRIKEQFPSYNYCLISNLSDIVENNVINDACDIGFVQGKPKDPDIVSSKVGTDRMVLVASSDFNIRNEVMLEELVKYPFVMLHDQDKCRRQVDDVLRENGLDLGKLNVLFNLDSTESVKSSVLKGHGLSFLPYISVKKELYTKQLREITVPGLEINYEVYIIYRRDRDMSRYLRDFIQFLKKIGEKSFC